MKARVISQPDGERVIMPGLTLDPPPSRGIRAAPARPSLLVTGDAPLEFAGLDDLARKLHALRRGAGLRLAAGVASYRGSDTFPVFKVWSQGPDGDEHYLATVAIQSASSARLEQAIARTNPDQAAA